MSLDEEEIELLEERAEDSEVELDDLLVSDVNESLKAANLNPLSAVETESFSLGRSAETAEIILYIFGGVALLFKGAKTVDDGWAVLMKWRVAIRHWLKSRHGRLSFEGLKVLCLCDINERLGDEAGPVTELISHTGAGAEVGDGTWEIVTPVHFAIPDAKRQCTHLYSISLAGEIQHYVEIPVFDEDSYDLMKGEIAVPLLEASDPSL